MVELPLKNLSPRLLKDASAKGGQGTKEK